MAGLGGMAAMTENEVIEQREKLIRDEARRSIEFLRHFSVRSDPGSWTNGLLTALELLQGIAQGYRVDGSQFNEPPHESGLGPPLDPRSGWP